RLLGLLGPRGGEASGTGRAKHAFSYVVAEGVLSEGERVFLPVLREAVRRVWGTGQGAEVVPLVFASVRLAEVLKVNNDACRTAGAKRSALMRVTQKQVDFVLCVAETTRPMLVIELDDQTHGRSDRRERDEFVDEACATAGLPILHVRAARTYDAADIANRIGGALSLVGAAGVRR
ncbi:MAG: DUF2726 domain-containing protein, partial [bacterium]|nr:DUF2726 domain-containing protein [bacterium]